MMSSKPDSTYHELDERIAAASDMMDEDGSDGSDDSGLESTSDLNGPRRKKRKRRGQWIFTSFKKKCCVKFVQDPNRSYKICYCGRNKRGHTFLPPQPSSESSNPTKRTTARGIIHTNSFKDYDRMRSAKQMDAGGEMVEEWNCLDCLKELPTDAFGEIHFKESVYRSSTSKFVRMSDNTEMKLVLALLTKYWKLSKPRLVISLTGGGRSFNLNAKDKETFSRGLINAAWTTDAWLLTSGFNAGVPEIVGRAVQISHTRNWIAGNKNLKKGTERGSLKCIGLTPWGYVDGSQQLLTRHGQGSYPAHYKVNPVISKGRPIPLNPDHSHFILIDNGLKGEQSYGGEIVMRSMIEEAIAAPPEENGLGLPVVMVVLEGGIDTVLNVKNAVMRGIPTVVCDGTGRAADIIAFAYNRAEGEPESRTLNAENLESLRSKLHSAFDIPPQCDNMDKLLEDVIICIKDKRLITVFQMMDNIENSGLDLAILIALLKAQATTPTYKLALALSWNRVDVAERRIFVDDQDWPPGSLDPFIMQSLMHNQVDFLRLFLEKGVVMKDFLTVSRLRHLYNSISSHHSLRSYVALVNNTKINRPFFLYHVGRVIKCFMGVYRNALYTQDKPFSSVRQDCVGLFALTSTFAGSLLTHQAQEEYLKSDTDWTVGASGSSSVKVGIVELANPGLHFKYPFRELFLASVLMCRMEMAKFFWERIEDSICSGIVASTIFKGMARLSKDPDDILQAEENARTFEQLAVDVMHECYNTDEVLAERLIRYPNKQWGGKNVLTLAAEADNKTFIAHSCAQSVVKKIWLGGMRTGPLQVAMAMLLPFLILKIKFDEPQSPQQKRLTPLDKLRIFYKSPITKFCTFVLSYAVFLLLYSYVMLATFTEQPSVPEMVLFGWILTMIIEEIRQSVIPGEHQTVKQRFREWSSSEWNIIDSITTIISILAFILHWFPEAYRWSQGFYAINCFMFYSRILRLFSVHEKLGPKMVMIRKMVSEMMLFLCILLVFLLGYGVASNILLYPHQEFGMQAISNSFYMPYFQIYGELFLDTINSEAGDSYCDINLPTCPRPHILLPFMLGSYLLLGNVLLLNLLIAIFSSIFDEVQTNSLEIWKFELYFLMVEFEDRPSLPPPFILIEHTCGILVWAWRKVFLCCKTDSNNAFHLTKKMKRVLLAFEKDCAANYRRQKKEKKNAETPERLNMLEKRLKDLDRQAGKTREEVERRLQQIQQLLENSPLSSPTITNVIPSTNAAVKSSSKESEITEEETSSQADDTLGNIRDYSGTRQLMIELERRLSQQTISPQQRATQRQKQLLCQLNEEMVRTAPPVLSSGSESSSIHSRQKIHPSRDVDQTDVFTSKVRNRQTLYQVSPL